MTLNLLIKKYFGHISSLKLLSGSFALLCVLSVLLTGWLLLRAAGGVVDQVLEKTAAQAQQATQDEVEHFLQVPDLLLRYILNAIDNNYVDASDVSSFQTLFWDTPGRGEVMAFSSMYFGNRDGELIGLGSRNLEWPTRNWTFSLSTNETNGLYTIYMPTADGKIGEQSKQLDAFDARDRPWYKLGAASGGAAVWSDFYTDFESGQSTLSRAEASFDSTGHWQGVAGVDMHIRHLQNFLDDLPLNENGEVFLVDSNGILMAAAAPSADSHATPQGKPIEASLLRFSKLAARHVNEKLGGFNFVDAPYRRHLTLDGEAGYLYVSPVGRERGLQWSLGIFLPESDYLGSITSQAKKVLPMMAFVVLTGWAIITGFLNLIVRPLKQLRNGALQISTGEFDVPIDTSCKNEIGDLSRAIDKMRVRLKHSFGALDEQKRQAQTTLDSIADGVLAIDSQNQVTYINPVACQLLGVESAQVVGKPIDTFMHATDSRTGEPLTRECIDESIKSHGNFTRELQLSDSLGQTRPVHCRVSNVPSESDSDWGAVAVFSDMTEEQRLKAELVHQATHDDLTQLYNRREFESRLHRAIESARSGKGTHAVCCIDLDRFKIVNDSCGHAAGDEMLRHVARLLSSRLRDGDILARLGGDEFGVLLEHCTLDVAEAAIDHMQVGLDDFRFFWEERSFTLSMSSGLVSIDKSTISVMTAMRDADTACYMAKDAGRNRIHAIHQDSRSLAYRREQIQSLDRINRALDEDRFVLYAQYIEPTVPADVDSALHVEILLRMLGESGEILSPEKFLQTAEYFDLGARIDRWVVHNSLQWISLTAKNATLSCRYSINLSGQSVGDAEFLDFILDELEQTTVPNHWLCFEITETAAIADMSSALKLMYALRDRGCALALDDFGSGLSSFAYLKNLPVDYLKIDGQFIRDMLDNPLDLAMVRSINEIGQTMGMKTIAEYVESDATRQQLQLLGVDFIQGYLFGQPCPLDELRSSILRRQTPLHRLHSNS